MTRMPPYYRPPMLVPLAWQDEQSGELPAAVRALYAHGAGKGTAPIPDQVTLICDYLRYYIAAPCWQGNDDLAACKDYARRISTLEEIDVFIDMCLEIGIDPL